MNVLTRSAVALAAAVPLALSAAPAGAAPVRSATTTSYTTATFVQHALGLPATDTNPVIEPVTYDRFQWLLQQPGNFAFLIGDPAEDATFAGHAQEVEAAASAAGVRKVYWFDPNLSGNAKVGNTTEPNLDIRTSGGITSLGAASQTTYGKAWLFLIGQYLGNNVTSAASGVGLETATVSAAIGGAAPTLNDAGFTAGASTEVGNTSGGALYDYSSGAAPANLTDSYFFIYNKDKTAGGQPQKIVSWVDLTKQAGSASADTTTAIGTVGAAQLAALDQFAWWKSEGGAREVAQDPSKPRGGDIPLLGDSDDADGWRVEQIPYPELVDLLKNVTNANAVILFGGTWCPNTRPVLKFINKYAQQNNVHVFNFDTVLDGGNVGGSTTSAANPLQSRNTAANGTANPNANPSFLYGDLVKTYLKNIVTQYNPTVGDGSVTYFPGGNTSSALTTVHKLQVPFLIGYQANASTNPDARTGGGVTRQWIQQINDVSGLPYYVEYMSNWWFTNPQPYELGLSIPAAAPIWSTINAQLASFTWQTDPATLYPNLATDGDDARYLAPGDTATVNYTAASGSTPASVTVSGASATAIDIGPATLASALSALGGAAPTSLAGAKTALIAAEVASSPQIANLSTVVGAFGIAQQRKTAVGNAWGSVTNPGSIAGGVAAVHALDVFFGGLPGGVVSSQTVSAASTVASGAAQRLSVSIANDYGRNPTGTLSLVVKKGGDTVVTTSAAVKDGGASFTLPVLGAGSYDYTLSYPGDDQILAFTKTGSFAVAAPDVTPAASPTPAPAPVSTPAPATTPIVVARVKASRLAGAIATAPTSKKAGRYKVTITAAKGKALATGKVTLELTKGKLTKTITGKLSKGVVTVTVPKLAKGTWTVAISWAGDANYLASSAKGASIKVTK